MHTRDALITLYFDLGVSQKDILYMLSQRHGIILSLRHLKRILKAMQLSRRNNFIDEYQIIQIISDELKTSGMLHGYRWMHAK